MNAICKWLVLAGLSACSYQPGSFRDRAGKWPGTATTLGCIDVAVASGDDDAIAYSVGNRCEHRVVVDLASVRAVARDIHGREVPLVADDPRRELRPLALGAMWSGHAQIAYRGDVASSTSICVDVGRVDRSVAASERWICIAKEIR